MTSQTVRVLTSFALLTLACQPARAQPPVSISTLDRVDWLDGLRRSALDLDGR
jgi:hypothetical protein